jgi:hypothetical protein
MASRRAFIACRGLLTRRTAILCGGSFSAAAAWSSCSRPAALCESASNTKKTAPVSSGPTIEKKCLAEAIGTAIIIQGGCGAVAASKYTYARTASAGCSTARVPLIPATFAKALLMPFTHFSRRYAGANFSLFGLAAVWGCSVGNWRGLNPVLPLLERARIRY